MVINKTKGLVALLMGLILSFAMLPSAHAQTTDANYGGKFQSYIEAGVSSPWEQMIHIVPSGDAVVADPASRDTVAYCFNMGQGYPSGLQSDGTPNDFLWTKTKDGALAGYTNGGPLYQDPTLTEKVLAIAYNGYGPNTPGINLQKQFNLSDKEYYTVTQLAVWTLTDKFQLVDRSVYKEGYMRQPSPNLSLQGNAALYTLLGATPQMMRDFYAQAKADGGISDMYGPKVDGIPAIADEMERIGASLTPIPSNMALDIYQRPANSTLQNLLSAKAVDSNTGQPIETTPVTTTPVTTTEAAPSTSVVTVTPTTTVTETAPVVTDTVTETAPAVTEVVTETAPAVTNTVTETQPDVTETTTLAASTVVETTQEPTATITETLPAETVTSTETAPVETVTETEAPVTETITEPAVTTTSVVAGTTVVVSTTEPAVTETSVVPGTTVVETSTEPDTTTTSTVPGNVVVTTETAPAVTTTVTEAPTTVEVTETAPAVTNTTTLPAETTVVTETLPVVTSIETLAPTTTTVTESKPAVTETTVVAPTTTETVTATAPAVTTTVPGATVTSTAPATTVVVAGPRIGTIATDKADGDKVISNNGGIVVDTVAYEGLIPGTEYKMIGELMTKDGKSTGITASTTFVPTEASGVVTLEFTVPDNKFEGQALVVFEELQLAADGSFVAEHKDINDGNQTIVVQEDNGTVPEVPGSTDTNPWWKVLIPVAIIGGGLLVLSNLGSSEGSSAKPVDEVRGINNPAPVQQDEVKGVNNPAPQKGIPADQAKQAPAKKMLASTGASVLGLSALAALMLALGLFFVARRKES
ncbi:VaFE repeat-containing surface-anchored protein [Corynebacterium sp. H130]|uniref:VaFE repeat-containing surface-anchored protein n=1 Tax=Corynebacterium sp. H130 TaxID=3133444 RepID=UPI0030B5A04C